MCGQRGSFSTVVLTAVAVLASAQGLFGEDAEFIADRTIGAIRAQVERLTEQDDAPPAPAPSTEGDGPLAVRTGLAANP